VDTAKISATAPLQMSTWPPCGVGDDHRHPAAPEIERDLVGLGEALVDAEHVVHFDIAAAPPRRARGVNDQARSDPCGGFERVFENIAFHT
jgi:hypothetical protein